MGDTPEPIFFDVGDTPIAVRYRPGSAPGLVWLGGYRSDMLGTKARRLDAIAAKTGQACLRHDYSGHGESGGSFKEGTISRWLEESLAVFRHFAQGPQILVGSSMGGWLALRMVEELHKAGDGAGVAGLVLVAPAPDFTRELVEPAISEAQRRSLVERGYFEVPSEYAPEPDIYTRALIEDGARNLVLTGILETGCPVDILQGMRDEDVPYQHALKLVEHLPVDDVSITLVRDGDHRLSRPQDLDLLERTVTGMLARAAPES